MVLCCKVMSHILEVTCVIILIKGQLVTGYNVIIKICKFFLSTGSSNGFFKNAPERKWKNKCNGVWNVKCKSVLIFSGFIL